MIYIHENMGDTLEFAEGLGWVDDDGPDGDLTEESALDFIRASGYVMAHDPTELAARVRSRYKGDEVKAISEVIDHLERQGEVTLYPTEDEPGYSDRGHDDYWTDFWLTVESIN